MKLALMGTRGIPNRYGGFEAFFEELSKRLADRGHDVTVYCRRAFTTPQDVVDPRVRRVILPGFPGKHLDTPVATLLSVLHVMFTRTDAIVMCNVANSLWAWMPRLTGKPVVLNVDGLDRTRKKWGWLARVVLSICEWSSTFTPTRVVTDSETMREYYRARHGKDSAMIGYGAEVPAGEEPGLLARLGLKPKNYILYVSRLEKENNPELVLEACKRIATDWPLVMVGSNAYDAAYVERLKSQSDARTVFPGAIYGPGYWTLQKNAGMFIFACEVGGIHPALIESMAAGNATLYLDTPSNRETAGDCGLPFQADAADLAAKISQLLAEPARGKELGNRAALRAAELYGWNTVTDKYLALIREALA